MPGAQDSATVPLLEPDGRSQGTQGPQPTPSQYREQLEDEVEETQHLVPLPTESGFGRILLVALAGLLVLGLGTFVATYAVVSNGGSGLAAPPECRKSAVLVITEASSLGHVHKDGSPDDPQRQALIWSGKGHKEDLLFQDLHAFDLGGGHWHPVYDDTSAPPTANSPIGRWKAVAAYSDQLESMVLFGGDSVVHEHGVNRYLDDLWYMGTDRSFPSWQLSPADNDSSARQAHETFDEPGSLQKGAHPAPRRAHAGAVLDLGNSPTLVIFGGKMRSGAVLGDVWATALDLAKHPGGLWRQLWDPVASQGPAPVARKGHVAVAVPGPSLEDAPSLFVWGGRNDTQYLEDGWLFHLANNTWEAVPANSSIHQPRGRDHMGAFHWGGSVWLYGGRGGPSYGKSKALDDLWSFSFATRAWSKQHVTGPAPPARFLYSMAFFVERLPTLQGAQSQVDLRTSSAAAPSMLIFGGEGADGCYRNDVWSFSLLSRNWTQLSANVPCQKRCGAGRTPRNALL